MLREKERERERERKKEKRKKEREAMHKKRWEKGTWGKRARER
jgi:hypothetical protein